MVWVADKKRTLAERKIVDRSMLEKILLTGRINRYQHFQLASALLGNPAMADEERCQINRVFDYIQTGRVRMID